MSFPLSTHQLTPPDFSIITIHDGSGEPPDLLPRAIASLVDQQSIKSEQILQHLGGVSNLWNKLSKELQLSKRTPHYTLRLLEEKNSPFHEALQRATTRVTGSFVGFLQPEEEYLPGTLIAVEKYFKAHPEIDILFTGALLQDEVTKKTTPQPALPLSLEYLWTAHPLILPGTLFVRASLFKKDFPFNPAYQELMFQEWLLRVLQKGKKAGALNTATIRTSALSSAQKSHTRLALPPPPPWIKLLTPWWKLRYWYLFKVAIQKNG
ncbi:MAG: hypothetical protein ACOYK6_08970 [Chthoniobacterales bacterium]